MARVYHLSPAGITEQAHQWTLRAEMWQSPAIQGDQKVAVAELALHIEGIRHPVSGLAAFFPVALLIAMRAEARLVVEGALPAEWKWSSRRFQELASSWFPALAPVEVDAAWEAEPAASSHLGEGVVFSCDLDSFHALHRSNATHLIHLGIPGDNAGMGTVVRAVADRMSLPMITVVPEIEFACPERINLADFPAVLVAVACNALSGQLRQITWGSPHPWSSLPGGGDHFSLAECFPAGDIRLDFTGRGATRLAKWQAVAAMPLARDFLHVCDRGFLDSANCGRCPACLSARLALHSLGVECNWPGLSGDDVLDSAAMATCISHDPAFCEQALGFLRHRDPESDLAGRLDAAIKQAKLDAWARKLSDIGIRAAGTTGWPKLSRRLLPQVLATATANDPSWLRSLAARHGHPPSQSDD